MNSRRFIILFMVIVTILQPASVFATRSNSVQLQCPVCNNSLSARELMSTNNFGGVDTDFMQRPMGASPILIRPATCLKCGFSGYIDDFSDKAKENMPATFTKAILQENALKPAVELASFTDQIDMPAWAKYDLIAQVRRLENAPAGDIAHQYLCAAWSIRIEDDLPLIKEDVQKAFELIQSRFADKIKNREVNPASLNVELAVELLKIAEGDDKTEARAALSGSLMLARQHGENPIALKALELLIPMLDAENAKKIEDATKAGIAHEQQFQKLAIASFKTAIDTEQNLELKVRFCYLAGELNRRLGDAKEAGLWFEKTRAIKKRPAFIDGLLAEVEKLMPAAE